MHVLLKPTLVLYPSHTADKLVSRLNADAEDGWSYEVAPTENANGMVKIVVRDETGAEVGTL